MSAAPESDPTLVGILALLVAARDGDERPTEVVLDDAGVDRLLISAVVAEKPDTVRKRIERHRKAKGTAL